MSPTKETINAAVINCLKNIYDPEIPVNIYDLGLIYNIDVNIINGSENQFSVTVLMTMTAPDCPEAEYMFREVKEMIGYIDGVKDVIVELTFDPPWSFDRLTDDVKAELGFL